MLMRVVKSIFYCPVLVFFSRQLAEEVLKASEREQEEEVETGTGFEGMEALTRAIETGEGGREGGREGGKREKGRE